MNVGAPGCFPWPVIIFQTLVVVVLILVFNKLGLAQTFVVFGRTLTGGGLTGGLWTQMRGETMQVLNTNLLWWMSSSSIIKACCWPKPPHWDAGMGEIQSVLLLNLDRIAILLWWWWSTIIKACCRPMPPHCVLDGNAARGGGPIHAVVECIHHNHNHPAHNHKNHQKDPKKKC